MIATGSNNTAIGANANVSSGALTNATAIGANALVTASNSLVLGNAANVGIGVSAPTAQLHTTGTVRFATFGAGTLMTDASGNVSVSSDERLKVIKGEFTTGLDAILQINPIHYAWNEISGMEQDSVYTGFSAQNVQSAIPEAISQDDRGYLTLTDRPITAALVNAVKELTDKIEVLETEKRNMQAQLDKMASLESDINELKALLLKGNTAGSK